MSHVIIAVEMDGRTRKYYPGIRVQLVQQHENGYIESTPIVADVLKTVAKSPTVLAAWVEDNDCLRAELRPSFEWDEVKITSAIENLDTTVIREMANAFQWDSVELVDYEEWLEKIPRRPSINPITIKPKNN